MQASKIMPKVTYAIVGNRGDHVRFTVTKVTTSRIDRTGSPHNYTSEVTGYVDRDDGGKPGESLTLKPEKILGPFENYVELVAKKKAEDDAREAEMAAKEAKLQRLRELLYAKTRVPTPTSEERKVGHVRAYTNPVTDHAQPFRAGYGNVEINAEHGGVDALIDLLERMVDPETVSCSDVDRLQEALP